ncbi:uncharacterized protein FA14DRAFT_177567 [Meira miltonrushii]|uniref:Uncharacterized protein n=1 Tax=Meira miltonrushii TaxID=1280837 RepID=A0A316VLX9_9BASI|nr:uncharacterized protein FA14DRAFT_177567 [Meira miltonrushii]PWN38294.1 hypothetical protein FA14DRAFT_177567 [Meira miltonrushii]
MILTKPLLFLTILVQVAWASTKPKDEQTVSPSMEKVFISSQTTPPAIVTDFLDTATYYGGQRSELVADDLLQQAFDMGLTLTTVQYDAIGDIKASEFVPGPPKDFHKSWEDGAYALAITCNKFGDSIVENLNKNCDKCGKVFTLGLFWGTFKGMNFDKDAILSAGCSALEMENSDSCFQNFPKGCSLKAVGDPVSLWTEQTVRIAENSGSKEEIVAALKKYGQEKSQNITLPST